VALFSWSTRKKCSDKGTIFNHKDYRLMKQIAIIIILVCARILCNAQVALEHTFSGLYTYSSLVTFSSYGTKYMTVDTGTALIKLYNTDYSLWKTITPPSYPGYVYLASYFVSDHLFNSDDNIEMVVTYGNATSYKAVIIDELGSQLFDLGDAYTVNVWSVDGSMKLVTHSPISTPSFSYTDRIYSLPGDLPCSACNSLKTGELKQGASVSQPVPNPSSGKMQITYSLPFGTSSAKLTIFNNAGQIIKSYSLNPAATSITVDNTNLPDGFYHYSLSGDGFAPINNSFVK
jgi:hypothetical protein